jgi:hypothetical protein
MRTIRNPQIVIALTGLILGQFFAMPIAHADQAANCRISASPWQTVSLGFPLAPERLANIAKPKILVIPFKFNDNPTYTFTSQYKRDYEDSSANIAMFSTNKSIPEFVYLPPIDTEFTNSTMDALRAVQQNANQWKDESVSTWGFVRRFIAAHDSAIDFTGIKAVILEGSSTSKNSYIAEAMMMSETARDPYFRPVETKEGKIYNFSLLDKHPPASTITHEIMHLYGLTDLYGTNTGPANLSLMASQSMKLLSYEKWVLGWVPDSEVQCLSNPSNATITKIEFDYSKPDQLFVLKTSGNTHYIIETAVLMGTKKLSVYSLNNELRPPIALFPAKSGNATEGLQIDNFKAIGSQLFSADYTVLVSDIKDSSLVLNLVPNAMVQSQEFTALVKQADSLKLTYEAQAAAKANEAALKAQADAAAKAQADAEAKAAADLKAQADAAAKAAAAKAQVDAAAKAAAPKVFKNCAELNKVYPGGVALPGAINSGGGTKKSPKYNKALYLANKKSDRDKDGIACEK